MTSEEIDEMFILHSRVTYEKGFLQLPRDRQDQQTTPETPLKPGNESKEKS